MEKEKHLNGLSVSDDLNKVQISFTETSILPIPDGADPEMDNEVITNEFKVKSESRPHKDLINSMKKLRKHGLAIIGIELADESKQLSNWIVTKIKISGDVFKQQSRVEIFLGVRSDLTGKISELSCGQVTMYPKDDEKVKYVDAPKMTAIIEDIIEECWSYLDGKCEEGMNPQMSLFPKPTMKVAPAA